MNDELAPDQAFIVDSPLPDALNFEMLRDQGLLHLKELAGQVWTNYNQSDPGVTILEQLCYALTELGYCAQFPIEDVLTLENGKIPYRDQFFEPQSILTCNPVTLDDYRRLVYDQISEVRAIYFDTETDSRASSQLTGRYRSYFSATAQNFGTEKEQAERIKQVGERLNVLLNAHRNLGEAFCAPVELKACDISLAGKVIIAPGADVTSVRSQLSQALLDYEAPPVRRSGYQKLRAEGLSADQIFNGPEMQRGWIAGPDALGGKRNDVSLLQLNRLIASLDGVLNVQSLSFDQPFAGITNIAIDPDSLPNIILGGSFSLWQNGVNATTSALSGKKSQTSLARLRASHLATSVDANVDLFPPLPEGRFRDIEQYYSIQNTFPDMYGIGHNALPTYVGTSRLASVRQLKGYLLAFDQLLANEFSQLAHIGELLSFKPIQVQPVPPAGIRYNNFTTTYYCQPLYEVPYVESLLRGHNAFYYQFDPTQAAPEVARDAWIKFMQFPFNQYMFGLRQDMESETEANTRRDNILSHLMARQGDDASQYEDMINTCQWYGSAAQTRIVVKSIWLQNNQMLSYNRTKGFDFLMHDPLLPPTDAVIDNRAYWKLRSGLDCLPELDCPPIPETTLPWWCYPPYPSRDGAPEQALIYAAATITPRDLANFSTFELELNIMLGLSNHLLAIACRLYALLADDGFKNWLLDLNPEKEPFKLRHSDIRVTHTAEKDQVFEGAQCLLDIVPPSSAANDEKNYRVHANQLLWLALQRKGFLLIEHILLTMGVAKDGVPISANKLEADLGEIDRASSFNPYLQASLIFPGYVTLIQQPDFGNFIDTLLSLHWPAHIEAIYTTPPFVLLKPIIANFVTWYNTPEKTDEPDKRIKSGKSLIKLLKFLAKSGGQSVR
jgi:hypothetical protein